MLIQLHFWPGACSIAPHILLVESGLPFEAVKVQPTRDYKFPEEFRRLNPKLRIPVLVLNGEIVITESTAIMTAIAQLVPEKHWLGRTNIETVRVYEWMNWLSGTVHGQAWGQILRPGRYCDDPNTHKLIQRKGKEAAQEMYRLIEDTLGGVYAVGYDLTIVDPFLYVLWLWAAGQNLVSRQTHPKYAQLVDELVKRESVTKVLETEKIAPVEL